MRIDELTRPENRTKASVILAKAGYKKLGDGLFARVWQKPGVKYVLKLFHADDVCYANYVRLIKRHQNNPHFPKVYGQLVKVTPEYYAVRLEPLRPGYIQLDERIRSYINLSLKYRPTRGERNRYKEKYADVIHQYPQLSDALELILRVSPRSGRKECHPDISFDTENIMLRSGKFPVFTDPLV